MAENIQTAAEYLAQYQVVYLNSDGKMALANMNISNPTPAITMVKDATITADAAGNFYKLGDIVENAGWSLTPGGLVYCHPAIIGAISKDLPDNVCPLAMTANDSPAPLVASADSEAAGYEAYKAFDGDVSTFWQPSSGASGSLQLDYGAAKLLRSYRLYRQTSTDRQVAIAGLSQAADCVVSWTAHGLSTGQYVLISGITQAEWTALNGLRAITYIDADSFSVGVDTSGFGSAYDAGTDPGVIEPLDYPRDWTLQGSNDGANWDVLDTQADEAVDDSKLFTLVSQTTAYRYYKLAVTDGNSTVLGVGRIDFSLLTNLQIIGQALSATTLLLWPNQLLIELA